jgi:hypothetical protein
MLNKHTLNIKDFASYKTPEGVMRACVNTRSSYIIIDECTTIHIKAFMAYIALFSRNTTYDIKHILNIISDEQLLIEETDRILRDNEDFTYSQIC